MSSKFIAALGAAGLGLALLPAGASATITTLDFSGAICGVAGNAACGNSTQIGQNYGDTPGVIDLSYRSILASNGTTAEAFLKYWSTGYGDLTGVIWGGSNATNYISEIVFMPAPGYEVSLIGFDGGATRTGRAAAPSPMKSSPVAARPLPRAAFRRCPEATPMSTSTAPILPAVSCCNGGRTAMTAGWTTSPSTCARSSVRCPSRAAGR